MPPLILAEYRNGFRDKVLEAIIIISFTFSDFWPATSLWPIFDFEIFADKSISH